MGDKATISRWRLLGALLGGHLAAAYSFAASMLLLIALTDPSTSMPQSWDGWLALARGIAFSPLAVAAVSLWTGMLMAPASLLTSPFTYFVARRWRTELLTTVAIGAAMGAAEVGIMVLPHVLFEPLRPSSGSWLIAIFPVSAAAAGVAYSAVVWRLCIRPRLERCGGARWAGM